VTGLVCLAGWLLIGRLNLAEVVPNRVTSDR